MLFEFMMSEVRITNLTIKKEERKYSIYWINTLKSCIKIKLRLIFFIMIFMYVLFLSYLIIIFWEKKHQCQGGVHCVRIAAINWQILF
jgi:hypothetical protein